MCADLQRCQGLWGLGWCLSAEVGPVPILDQGHCLLVILSIGREGPGPVCAWKSVALLWAAACDLRTAHTNLTYLRLKTVTPGQVRTPLRATLNRRTAFKSTWPLSPGTLKVKAAGNRLTGTFVSLARTDIPQTQADITPTDGHSLTKDEMLPRHLQDFPLPSVPARSAPLQLSS